MSTTGAAPTETAAAPPDLSTAPVFAEDTTPAGRTPSAPPTLTPLQTARWAWRQLTSMRTALLLLFGLALAAIPGSLFPQRPAAPSTVLAYVRAHPRSAPWLDRLGLFDVYRSPWFSAIYLLLFVSLVGCVLPRARVHVRALRSRPTLTPRNFSRLPASARWVTDTAPGPVLEAAVGQLRRRHRLGRRTDPLAPVAAERGYLRETGNLLFHLSLLVILAGLAWTSLAGYRGTAIVVEGQGFADTLPQYDDFRAGRLVDPARLPPFSFTLRSFAVDFALTGQQRGLPTRFDARLSFRDAPGDPARPVSLQLNHPVTVGGAQVSLIANGYAPILTVRDGTGRVVSQGPTVFLPIDGNYTSTGAVKVPGARPQSLGITGNFLPTADPKRPNAVFPAAYNPELRLTFYHGDLGLDSGRPQSVYLLDTSRMTQFRTQTGQPLTATLRPGSRFELPDGAGSVEFGGYRRWINVQVAGQPGTPLVLAGAVALVVGLCGSLFVRRRRFWVRATTEPQAASATAEPPATGASPGRTVVEVAGLDRSGDPEVAEDLDRLVAELQHAAPPVPGPTPTREEIR